MSFSGDSVMSQLADAGSFALDRTHTATSHYHLFATIENGQGPFWANEHESFAPDVIVMLLGTWEDFRMLDGGLGDPPYSAAWDARYGRVVRRHLQWMTRGGTEVVWIGMPVSPPQFNLDFERLNAVYRREVERADGTYLDGTAILAAAPRGDTGFTETAAGRLVPLRGVDGHHLCPPAARLMMVAVLDTLVAGGEIDRRPDWAGGYRWRPQRFPFDTRSTLRCNRAFTQADADLAATGIFRPQPAGP